MHDVGMNMGQLAFSVHQIDQTIELAHAWTRELEQTTDTFAMDRIGAKLEGAAAALEEARRALSGYEDAIEADHNSVGTVRLV